MTYTLFRTILLGCFVHLSIFGAFAQNLNLTLNTPPPICANDLVSCEGNGSIGLLFSDACDPGALQFNLLFDAFADQEIDEQIPADLALSGNYPFYTLAWPFPIGEHLLLVEVNDACTTVSATLSFSIVDCTIAPIHCIADTSATLQPTEPGTDADGDGDLDAGAIGFFASNLIEADLTDCSNNVTYSVHRQGATPDINQVGIVFTCDDPIINNIVVYAWDNANNPYAVQPDGSLGGSNYDSCALVVTLSDDLFCLCSDCGPADPIYGSIVSLDDELIDNAQILFYTQTDTIIRSSENGSYLANLPYQEDCTVQPYFNPPIDEVGTLDLILITKHILGADKFVSPYQMIAADVDHSGAITVGDLIALRRVLLAITDSFPNNTSWRFIPESYVFPNPNNPWAEAFPEQVNVNFPLPDGFILEGDFIGIRIGDVSY